MSCDLQEALELAASIASVQEGKARSRADQHRQPQVCVILKAPFAGLLELLSTSVRSQYRLGG
jgi:hypothetical protein